MIAGNPETPAVPGSFRGCYPFAMADASAVMPYDYVRLVFAAIISLAGCLMLWAGANLLSAMIALATLVIYAVVYTPSKPLTSFSTVIGAIPGALPPMIGWAAARGSLEAPAWALFFIVFLWQLPHFLAIAWLYREDYARAGLPITWGDGVLTVLSLHFPDFGEFFGSAAEAVKGIKL